MEILRRRRDENAVAFEKYRSDHVHDDYVRQAFPHRRQLVALPAKVQLLVTTGFLGGLTTFSTFDYETTSLIEEEAPKTGVLNIGITVVACVMATVLGLSLARRLVSLSVGH